MVRLKETQIRLKSLRLYIMYARRYLETIMTGGSDGAKENLGKANSRRIINDIPIGERKNSKIYDGGMDRG